jgi:hypothetical protein
MGRTILLGGAVAAAALLFEGYLRVVVFFGAIARARTHRGIPATKLEEQATAWIVQAGASVENAKRQRALEAVSRCFLDFEPPLR